MSQNNQNTNLQNQENNLASQSVETFNGYTLDEIKYQRALVALKAEFCKEKIISEFNTTKKNSIVGRFQSGDGIGLFKSGIFNKMAKSLNYIDYLLVGTAAYKSVRSIMSLFRKK